MLTDTDTDIGYIWTNISVSVFTNNTDITDYRSGKFNLWDLTGKFKKISGAGLLRLSEAEKLWKRKLIFIFISNAAPLLIFKIEVEHSLNSRHIIFTHPNVYSKIKFVFSAEWHKFHTFPAAWIIQKKNRFICNSC